MSEKQFAKAGAESIPPHLPHLWGLLEQKAGEWAVCVFGYAVSSKQGHQRTSISHGVSGGGSPVCLGHGVSRRLGPYQGTWNGGGSPCHMELRLMDCLTPHFR